MTRIFLIHAYAPSIPPIAEAFRTHWPEAQALNLLDESLYADVGRDGALPSGMLQRISALFRHAQASGAQGIVFTGSTFGPAVDTARGEFDIPILKADQAMCAEAAARGGRVLVVCTARRALPVILANLAEAGRAEALEPTPLCVELAKAALEMGDHDRHCHLIAEAIGGAEGYDTVLLGQASMAPARALLSAGAAARTLTSPDATVAAMRRMLAA